ncbi:MAG TPA: hypothetical protein VMT11_12530 [Myxococcaceae bacterium]|nr:hypothetical protein [Myxococcaceae bacterium]
MRLVLLLAVLVLVFVWGWERNSDARAIARMNPAERAKLYAATRAEAIGLCSDPELLERCRAQVELLSHFPECDGECQTFVARYRPRGVR